MNSIAKALVWGLIPSGAGTTTSLSLDGKPLRRDVGENIQKIASLLKNQSQIYPVFKPKQLRRFLHPVLGPVDERTRKKYVDMIIRGSEKNLRYGTIDVTSFCNTFGL